MSKEFDEFMDSVENMHSNKKKMTRDAIYRLLRGTFHSQSGLFLNKEQCMALSMVIYNFKQNGDVNLNKTKDYEHSEKQGQSPEGSP